MVPETIETIQSQFPVSPAVSDEQMKENMRSACGRKGLHRVGRCHPHKRTISVAGGGPSLADTYTEMTGDVAAINGSLDFLVERGVTPWACGVLDPGDHMADIVSPHKGVFYFVASVCHPSVFDRLDGCDVILWHPSGMAGAEDLVADHDAPDALLLGGGSTMGLRWVNLAYLMGYRSFDLHGLDSSFRKGRTHAYPDRRDGGVHMAVEGFETSQNFLAQIADFFGLVERFDQADIEETEIKVRGDGLLQHYWRKYEASREARQC